MQPQLLSQIPIESIERIEILKGTGSVEYGDGATAGVINVITKDKEGAGVKFYAGSDSLAFGSLSFGAKQEKIGLYGYFDTYRFGGAKELDAAKQKDEAQSSNKQIKLTYDLSKNLSLYLGKKFSDMDVYYPNAITLAQFEADPKTNPMGWTEQKYDIDTILFGFEYDFAQQWKLSLDGSREDKVSEYVNWASKSRYDTDDLNLKLSYKDKNYQASWGIGYFDGERKSTSTTSKQNLATYIKADFAHNQHNYLLGLRFERVKYAHQTLSDDENLFAYEFGYNYQLDKYSSYFANLNHSYLSPNIDAFFLFGGGFNTFIDTQETDTLSLGYNYFGYPHKLKISSFYSLINDEIYYNGATFANTNIDKTQKYGLELFHRYNFRYNLASVFNYAYVDTKIKKDAILASGGEIPGVSNHNVKLALEYKPTFKSTLTLSHTYKSKAYAMSDFDQSFGKMQAYHSTDFQASYKLKNIELFAKIDNLFAHENGLFADNGTSLGVYSVNYQRSFLLGLKGSF